MMRDSYLLYQDKLQGEYKETFKQIDMYFSTQNVDGDTHEEYMGDLLDVFLVAQEEGRPVEKIVGKNLESFCKSFCSNLTGTEKVLGLSDDLKRMAWLTLVFALVELLFSWENIIGRNVNIFLYIIGLGMGSIISRITGYVTKSLMFRMKKVSVFVWKIICAGVFLVVFLTILILLLGEREINLPAEIACVVSSSYLLLDYLLNRNRMAERKAHRISFWGMVKEEIEKDQDDEMLKQMKKIYEKKNDRLRKRGKKELAWNEYLDLLEEDVRKAYRWKPLYDWFPIIVTIPCGVIIYLMDGFNMQFVSFLVFLFLVELVLVKGMWKIVQKGLKAKKAWVELARKNLG